MLRRGFLRFGLSFGCLLLLCGTQVVAQDYPNKTIRIVAAHPPGGGADIFVRYFAEKLQPMAGQPVIVENKPGADGAIGNGTVIHAKPDGYTILINLSNAVIGNTFFMKDADYDPLKALAPIALLGKNGLILITGPKTGVTNFQEALKLAKSKSTKFGVTSAGTRTAMELLKLEAGLDFLHVNYRGAADALSAVASGEVDFAFSDPVSALGQVNQGRVIPLAVSTSERSSVFPNLPTLAQEGVTGYDFDTFWGAWAPAGTPDDIITKLEGWLLAIARTDATKDNLRKFGMEAATGDHKALAEEMAHNIATWELAVRKAGIEKQ